MKYPTCYFDNPDDSIYCSKCATGLDQTPWPRLKKVNHETT